MGKTTALITPKFIQITFKLPRLTNTKSDNIITTFKRATHTRTIKLTEQLNSDTHLLKSDYLTYFSFLLVRLIMIQIQNVKQKNYLLTIQLSLRTYTSVLNNLST